MDRQLKHAWYEGVPKVELHLHLEGAIPDEALLALITKYGGGVDTVESLRERFRYRDFQHFIRMWCWKNQFIRQYEDFSFVAESVARDLAAQHIYYCEAFFSPRDFSAYSLEVQQITEAIRRGLSRVPEVEVALIADLVRDYGAEQAATTLAQLREVRSMGVIGIGIGGSEDRYPPGLFEAVYEEARRSGFMTTAHAGEVAGPQSIWEAINRLKVNRIGHGTRAREDAALVDFLVERGIPLEVCPISNVRTGIIDSLERHPVRYYFEKGVRLSVNTDDPRMFGNSLAEEYLLLEEKLGFSRQDIRALIMMGIETSWMSESRKSHYRQRFIDDQDWKDAGE